LPTLPFALVCRRDRRNPTPSVHPKCDIGATTVIRRLVLLILAGATIGLSPLALACPPDQHWLTGLYDDADYDDVVLAVTSSVASVDTQSSSRDCQLSESPRAVVLPTDESLRATPRLSSSTRGPPA